MMTAAAATIPLLRAIECLTVLEHEPLGPRTRFGIGGPARVYAEAMTSEALRQALAAAAQAGLDAIVVGGGSNLIVSDAGFDGLVLRYAARRISLPEPDLIVAEAGADLQTLVDRGIESGLAGLHTMTGIPGTVGGAVYGNAGAYGHSIAESVESILFLDQGELRRMDNAGARFRYRESSFKQRKERVILAASLRLSSADPATLRAEAGRILAIRNEKYPPKMKCAGSIFKNLILDELADSVHARVPAAVVREGKVPAAYFLEQAGAKGLRRGGIEVATYHANLIYNTGAGTAAELRDLIAELKLRVQQSFGLDLEEEVQYVG